MQKNGICRLWRDPSLAPKGLAVARADGKSGLTDEASQFLSDCYFITGLPNWTKAQVCFWEDFIENLPALDADAPDTNKLRAYEELFLRRLYPAQFPT